jgi:Caspase domain
MTAGSGNQVWEEHMPRIFVLALLTCSLFTADQARAQKLHAVLVGDTLDASIGKGINANLKNMDSFLYAVELDGKISVTKTEIKGDNFNCKKIHEAVEQLNVEPTDAVLFYYSGHGFRRDNTQTQFPEFDCRRTSDPDQAALSSIVNDLINAKKPKFLLAIADTCNKQTPAQIQGPPAAFAPAERAAAFRRLFEGYSGTLIMSGAVPGEYSWYTVAGGSLGGFFTNQLLQAINQKIKEEGSKVRWEDISADATKTIFVPGMSEPTYQHPQSAALNLVGP